MANSPVALDGFLQLQGALVGGVLSEAFQEQVTVTLCISEISGCNYCLGAHTAIGKGVGLSEEETISSRKGRSADYKIQVGLEFVRKIIPNQGWVSDHDYNLVKQAGCSSEEVIEIIALVENTFSPTTSTISQELQLIFLRHETRASQLFHKDRNWSMKTGSILVVPNILTCWWL
jgi:AhpD family alkylhydroperoxidase